MADGSCTAVSQLTCHSCWPVQCGLAVSKQTSLPMRPAQPSGNNCTKEPTAWVACLLAAVLAPGGSSAPVRLPARLERREEHVSGMPGREDWAIMSCPNTEDSCATRAYSKGRCKAWASGCWGRQEHTKGGHHRDGRPPTQLPDVQSN